MKSLKLFAMVITVVLLIAATGCENSEKPALPDESSRASNSRDESIISVEESFAGNVSDVIEVPVDKERYYADYYLQSDDFGFAGDTMVITYDSKYDEDGILIGNKSGFILKTKKDDGSRQFAIFIHDDKVYANLLMPVDGEIVDKWACAAVPENENPLRGVNDILGNNVVEAEELSDGKYIETVEIDGARYDRITYLSKQSSGQTSEIEAFVHEDTKKIGKMLYSQRIGGPRASADISDKSDIVVFPEVPDDIEENEYSVFRISAYLLLGVFDGSISLE